MRSCFAASLILVASTVAASASQTVAFAGKAENGALYISLEALKPGTGALVEMPKYIGRFKWRKTHYTFTWNTKRVTKAELDAFATEVCESQKRTVAGLDLNMGGGERNQRAAFTCR